MPFRILIADDNPLVRTALKQLLAGPDREVVEAEDGGDAVSKALEMRPDIAILDLAMPVMDGLNASRTISQQLPDLPVLLCTMHWGSHLELEAKKYGIRRVIAKSESGVLVKAVHELLDTQRAQEVPGAQPGAPMVLAPETLPTPLAIESEASANSEPASPAAPLTDSSSTENS